MRLTIQLKFNCLLLIDKKQAIYFENFNYYYLFQELDPNHTHFLLVDDGSENAFGKEIEFRAKIEKVAKFFFVLFIL